MNDVCFTHPPGEAAGKGSTVRALRRNVSWVQNVEILRWRRVTLLLALAYIGETCVKDFYYHYQTQQGYFVTLSDTKGIQLTQAIPREDTQIKK